MTVTESAPATATWKQSISRARAGERKAMQGRFEIALASFEQFPIMGSFRPTGKTLLDFANDAGISYDTLTSYRSVVSWWLEFDADLYTEIGVPTNLNWFTLRWCRSRFTLAADLRAALATRRPPNGKFFTTHDVQDLWETRDDIPVPANPEQPRRERETNQEYRLTLFDLHAVQTRTRRLLDTVRRADLTDTERADHLARARAARVPLDALILLLEGADERDVNDVLEGAAATA